MSDCPFCQLFNQGRQDGAQLYEDDLLYAAHYEAGEATTYLGYLVFGTKRHATIADLTDDEARGVGLLAARLSRALRDVVHAEKVYVYTFGEAYQHLHCFAVARYPHTPPEYLRLRLLDWPDAPRADAEQIAVLCAQLRDVLKGPVASGDGEPRPDDPALAR